MDDKPNIDRTALADELHKLAQLKNLPPAFQAPIEQRIADIKALLLAHRTPESRHQAAAKKLAKAKQRMVKHDVAVEAVRGKLKLLQDDLAIRLAEKAATYASILALQDEFTRTALEATGGNLDRGGLPTSADEEIAGAAGIDPANLRICLEKLQAKMQSEYHTSKLVDDAAEAARVAQANVGLAPPHPGLFPAAPGFQDAKPDGSKVGAGEVLDSEAESEHESDRGRSRSPRARKLMRKEAKAATDSSNTGGPKAGV